MDYELCTKRDDFVWDKCIWIAKLSDGTEVFQDDNRRGIKEPSAWIRLGKYIIDNSDIKIMNWKLRLGTHTIDLPGNRKYYFYSKGLIGDTYGTNTGFHIVGWPSEKYSDVVDLTWYRIPELIVFKTDTRSIEVCKPVQLIGYDG